GTGFSNLISTSVPVYNGSSLQNFFFYDANGDGLPELGYRDSFTGAIGYYAHNGGGQPPDLLSSVTDGYGNSASPPYLSVAQTANSHYFLWSDAQYTYQNYMGPLYIVGHVAFSDPTNGGATYYHDHYYAGAWTNLQGRGFSGFGAHQVFDSRNSFWETLSYH